MRSGKYGRMVKFGHGYKTDAPSEEFGKKASILAEMASMDIPIPPGFVLNVSVCEDFFKNGRQLPPDVPDLLKDGISFLEKTTGLYFGNERRPLLVSVRSGSAISMPGAMETVLDIGLNHDTVRGMILLTGNPRFAWDSYRRLLENFGSIVFCHGLGNYSSLLEEMMENKGIQEEKELDSFLLRELVNNYERVFQNLSGRRFPQESYEQLELAVIAVLESWMSPKALEFRSMEGTGKARGTAVTVQAMVFGNRGMHSGSGVAFTRNPWTGQNDFVIDFKFGAQGEDMVSGYRAGTTMIELMEVMPDVYKDLVRYGKILEGYYRNMQDIEFTVQDGKLYILQSRDGKRAPMAALKIAVDMYEEGIIDKEDALQHLEEVDLDAIMTQEVISESKELGKGDSASSGVISGFLVLSNEKAESLSAENKTILIKETPSPDDIKGIRFSSGYLTAGGARTSHAAVIARQMGKVCIVNFKDLHIDADAGTCIIGGKRFVEGDIISIDGNSGMVYEGKVDIRSERPVELLLKVKEWKEISD